MDLLESELSCSIFRGREFGTDESGRVALIQEVFRKHRAVVFLGHLGEKAGCRGWLLGPRDDDVLTMAELSAFLGSPRILKGGIVLIDAASSTVLQVIALQYAPDSLTHSLAVQTVSADGVGRLGVLRLKGLPAFPGCTSAVATFGHGLQEADRT